jgi:hypothetical protein
MRTKPRGSTCWQKATQELGSHDALLIAVSVVSPSEGHAMTIEAKQPLIADGHAMGIAAQIAQHAFGFTKSGLGIDDPVLQ